MDMLDGMGGRGDDACDRVFLDVEVEGVVEIAVIGFIHLCGQGGRGGGGVQDVAFEPVQRFDRQGDARRGRILGGGLVHLGQTRQFVGLRRQAGKLAQGLVERAGAQFAAQGMGAIDQPFDVVERRLRVRQGRARCSFCHRPASRQCRWPAAPYRQSAPPGRGNGPGRP